MAAAAAKVSTRLCAGYWEHDPRRVAASVRQCASIAGAATVGFMVPQPEGGCTVQFRSVSWKDRKWVRVRSDYARGGQFGSIIDILEMRGQSFDDYASTWQCQLDWERAVRGDDLPQETGDATRLRAEWKNFPASLRGFLCTAEHIGENLGAPAPDE